MNRFYKHVEAVPDSGGFTVHLDGRAIKTPAKAALCLPNLPLAQAVAAEWQAQGDKIIPDSMPLMTFAATTIDRVAAHHADIAADAARYAGSDLLCYRADIPVDLAQRQADGWDPILAWASGRYDVRFEVTTGLMPVDQPDETRARFQSVTVGYDPYLLTSLHVMTTAFGSLLLALAVAEGEIDVTRAFDLSRIDETYQVELWGEDEEAVKRRERLLREVTSAQQFFALCLPS